MQETEKRKSKYYRIPVWMFWSMIVVFVLLIGAVYFGEKIYEKWLHSGGRAEISYVGAESTLKEKAACCLCGSKDWSMMNYYRQFDTIGLISLNDWYVLDFKTEEYEEDRQYGLDNGYTCITTGNTGEIIYHAEETPSRGMASIEVTLPEKYSVDMEFLRENLCQECLDKVLESMEISKWKREKKGPIPLCLVDFKTLEIYSLQDWHVGQTIRDYWMKMDYENRKIMISVFTCPNAS